jgi:hypothetical protein
MQCNGQPSIIITIFTICFLGIKYSFIYWMIIVVFTQADISFMKTFGSLGRESSLSSFLFFPLRMQGGGKKTAFGIAARYYRCYLPFGTAFLSYHSFYPRVHVKARFLHVAYEAGVF